MSSVHLPRKESHCLTAAVVIAMSPIFHFIVDPLGFQKYATFIRRNSFPCALSMCLQCLPQVYLCIKIQINVGDSSTDTCYREPQDTARDCVASYVTLRLLKGKILTLCVELQVKKSHIKLPITFFFSPTSKRTLFFRIMLQITILKLLCLQHHRIGKPAW